MRFGKGWSRRRFLTASGAVAAQVSAGLKGFGQAAGTADKSGADALAAQKANAAEAARAMPASGVITGGIQPLMASMTARPLRYRPINGEFVIRNGREFFNRPIYGVSTPTQSGDFRVDAGDLPEFSLYLPGHGGNLKLGIIGTDGKTSKWGADADEVIARYRPGRMIYEIRDALLGKGMLRAELLTAGEGAGFLLKVEAQGVPAGARLAWAFAGVSGRKGQRNGDIGCERQPVAQFFQVRPEECDGNSYTIEDEVAGARRMVRLSSKPAEMILRFPAGSWLEVEDFAAWDKTPSILIQAPGTPGAPEWKDHEPHVGSKQPILTGSVELIAEPLYLTLNRIGAESANAAGDPAK